MWTDNIANLTLGGNGNGNGTESSTSAHYNPWNIDANTIQEIRRFLNDQENIWLPWMTAGIYGLRPNPDLRDKLNEMVHRTIPEEFDPKTAIGIPIRAGDKCFKEQDCMTPLTITC